MQIHELKSKFKRSNKKRIGRGGKRGTFSGRGTKGQKSRAGRKIKKAEKELILRLPKRRGFKNKPLNLKPIVLNLKDLAFKLRHLVDSNSKGVIVDRSTLEGLGILPRGYRGDVKILGGGAFNISLTLKNLKISKNAKSKIEKAGGKVE